MAKFYDSINASLQEFISSQKIFFVPTAAETGRINLSPKGMDSFRIVDENKVLWLNLTGSGNETAAHIQQVNRMTIMSVLLRAIRLFFDCTELPGPFIPKTKIGINTMLTSMPRQEQDKSSKCTLNPFKPLAALPFP